MAIDAKSVSTFPFRLFLQTGADYTGGYLKCILYHTERGCSLLCANVPFRIGISNCNFDKDLFD